MVALQGDHDGCSSGGLPKSTCACPRILSAGTVDNNIEKLRVIFRDVGRGSQWNDDLGLGSPAAHHLLSRYKLSVHVRFEMHPWIPLLPSDESTILCGDS